MPSNAASNASTLYPMQVCFVVDDIVAAAAFCEEQFGWGPFQHFTADIEDASYKGWRGRKVTEVALGMAGAVQVEFLHVHQGCDTTADYQSQYGSGFQHLGISVRSREDALAQLESLGAIVNETNEFPGVRFAFVDTCAGQGMFEILESVRSAKVDPAISKSNEQHGSVDTRLCELDRVTIVTPDIDSSLPFFAKAFGWQNAEAVSATLRLGTIESAMKRYVNKAGALQLELLEPLEDKGDPYSAHLRRGEHGLVHTGGVMLGKPPTANFITSATANSTTNGEWLESGESFRFLNCFGVNNAIQLRLA